MKNRPQHLRALLIDGSPASPSRVALLLQTVAADLETFGCKSNIVELHRLHLPINDPTYHATPEQHPSVTVRDFVALVAEADIIVLGTPLYHGSYSGLLKVALDHLHNDAFSGKLVGLVSNASGPRNAMQASQELVVVARTLKGDVLDRLVGTCKADYGFVEGVFQIIEPDILQRIKAFSSELVEKAQLVVAR